MHADKKPEKIQNTHQTFMMATNISCDCSLFSSRFSRAQSLVCMSVAIVIVYVANGACDLCQDGSVGPCDCDCEACWLQPLFLSGCSHCSGSYPKSRGICDTSINLVLGS
jgi:hypothetical protein